MWRQPTESQHSRYGYWIDISPIKNNTKSRFICLSISSAAGFIVCTDDILITFQPHATSLSLSIYISICQNMPDICHMKDVMTQFSICEVRIPCELLLLLLLSFPKPLMPHGISLSWSLLYHYYHNDCRAARQGVACIAVIFDHNLSYMLMHDMFEKSHMPRYTSSVAMSWWSKANDFPVTYIWMPSSHYLKYTD